MEFLRCCEVETDKCVIVHSSIVHPKSNLAFARFTTGRISIFWVALITSIIVEIYFLSETITDKNFRGRSLRSRLYLSNQRKWRELRCSLHRWDVRLYYVNKSCAWQMFSTIQTAVDSSCIFCRISPKPNDMMLIDDGSSTEMKAKRKGMYDETLSAEALTLLRMLYR